MALQDTDLLYVDRGGTSYQVTWLQVKTRTDVLATDELLVQRGGDIYQVPIGDFWDGTETSQLNDLYLVERAFQLYHTEIIFPTQVRIGITAATSTSMFLSAVPDALGNTPSVIAPDGTVTPLTATGTSYTFTQNGIYTLQGDFTNFKIRGSDGTVDASLTDGSVWNTVFAGVPDLGSEIFSNINELSGVPNGLALRSLFLAFMSTSPSGDLSTLDTSAVTNAHGAFLNSDIDPTDNIATWDTSNITDFSRMFSGASVFDVDISGWNVSSATNMAEMFGGASVFNSDISGWDVGNVTEMQYLFNNATTFNQDLGAWNVANVEDMSLMFDGASSFNQDIGDWDVEDVSNMDFMFNSTNQFDQDLTGWCVRTIAAEPTNFATGSALTNVNKPVWGTCPAPINGDVILTSGTLRIRGTVSAASQIIDPNGGVISIGPGNWSLIRSTPGRYTLPMEQMEWMAFNQNTSTEFDFDPDFYTGNMTNMSNMFRSAQRFNGDIANWDTSRVTNMTNMFYDARVFNGDISGWNTSSVTNAKSMFTDAKEFDQPIGNWNVGNITDFTEFFMSAVKFNQDISGWNVASATSFSRMFSNAQTFNQPISAWNMSSATNLSVMLRNTFAFNQDLSAWDTANVQNWANAFERSAINAPLNFDTSGATNMTNMFVNAQNFNQDINGWDIRNLTAAANMFNNAAAFNQSLPDWNPSSLNSNGMRYMFRNATAMEGDLSNWCVPQVTSSPTGFADDAGFEANTALQPDWGSCPITDPTGLIINNFNGDQLFMRMYYISGSGSHDVIFPDGSLVPFQQNTTVELTQLGQYELPMGVVRQIKFYGSSSTSQVAQNVDYTFEPGFYTSGLNSTSQMFRNSRGFNGNISGWDMSSVLDMNQMFDNAWLFNSDISAWDVSNVSRFYSTFENAQAFNQSISTWVTSSAENMSEMFRNARAYNQEMSSWDTGSVTNMSRMFQGATEFNQYLNPWDVSSATNMRNMFNLAAAMSGDISNWCVSRFRNKPSGFDNNAAFQNDTSLLPDWGTCTSFNGIYLRELVGGVGDFVIGGVASDNTVEIVRPDGTVQSIGSGTFANKYTQLGWYEIRNIESLTGLRFFDNDILFDDTSETAKFYFSDTFDTSGLNEFRQMFREANQFDGDLSMFDTSNATNMAAMFRNASSYDGDLSHFDTENVDNMSNMFRGASSFTGDISGWSVFAVTDMDNMFREATSFGVNLSNWCVPQIGSEPNNFDTNSGFDGDAAIQPGWGTCPLAISFTSPPVIDNENSTSPAPYSEDLEIVTAAVVDPSTATIAGYQWQRSADGVTGWTDIAGGEGVSNQATREVNGYDRNQYLRVVVTYSAAQVPDASIESNAILVENGNPPTYPLYTPNQFDSFVPLGKQVFDEAFDSYFQVQLLGTDGILYNYAGDTNVVGFIDPVLGEWTGYRELDFAGAGITAPNDRQYWWGGVAVPGANKHILMGRMYRGAAIYDYIADTWETITFDTLPNVYRNRGLVYSKATQKYYTVPYEPIYNSNLQSVSNPDPIFEIDPVALTGTNVFANRFTDAGRTYGRMYSGGAEGPDGKIYYFPNYVNAPGSPYLGQFDPQTYTMVDIPCPVPLSEMWQGFRYVTFGTPIYSPEGNAIYACPYNANSFIKLDFNNMVGGVPTASQITQTVDPRTATDGTTRGKWSGMVRREDGLLQCLPVVTQAPNAALDPTTDAVINLGVNTLGQNANSTFGGAIMSPNGKASSVLTMRTSSTGGTANRIKQSPFWETFAGPITIYDPVHPDYNKMFGTDN